MNDQTVTGSGNAVDRDLKDLCLASFWVAFAAFFVAILLGVYQVLERIEMTGSLASPAMYYASVSTHGVLMAFVLTIFVNYGFGYYVATTNLKQPIWHRGLAWTGFWVTVVGVLFAAVPLLTGNASVMYTIYPPHIAHPAFYLGLVLIVVGTWIWCLELIQSMRQWKRANPGEPVPLAMFGVVSNAVLWAFTSIGVAAEVLFQLLPASLGLIDTIDVGLARTLFSWTLHAIVYFWLFPAYIAMYTLVPNAAGGRLFSDPMARIAFIMLVVISVPIGFHHLYMDPFQAAGWKLLHAFGTFMVLLPTMFTVFTVIASLEIAGRLRGGKGLFGWIKALPWHEPLVLATGLAYAMLLVGGFGGMVNASYSMNAMIHNTAWVTGHFHLIFGGSVVIMYFAIAYHFWPRLTGRAPTSTRAAVTQLWLWCIGMLVLTLPWHVLGMLGEPRRISVAVYDTPLVQQWAPHRFMMLVGGIILLLSSILFVVNLIQSQRAKATRVSDIEYAEPIHPVLKLPAMLNGFGLWSWILAFWLIAAYGYPILQFFIMETFGTIPWSVS